MHAKHMLQPLELSHWPQPMCHLSFPGKVHWLITINSSLACPPKSGPLRDCGSGNQDKGGPACNGQGVSRTTATTPKWSASLQSGLGAHWIPAMSGLWYNTDMFFAFRKPKRMGLVIRWLMRWLLWATLPVYVRHCPSYITLKTNYTHSTDA